MTSDTPEMDARVARIIDPAGWCDPASIGLVGNGARAVQTELRRIAILKARAAIEEVFNNPTEAMVGAIYAVQFATEECDLADAFKMLRGAGEAALKE